MPASHVLFTAQTRNKDFRTPCELGSPVVYRLCWLECYFTLYQSDTNVHKFLVWTHSFTQYVLVQFMANQNFAKTAGFRSAGHKLHFFSLYLFVYLFENIIFSWFICAYCFKRKNGWRASRINYWNTHKPVRLVLSYVLCSMHSNISKEQHEKHLCNPSSYCGKYRE